MTENVSAADLPHLMRLDAESGFLFWLPRGEEWFRDTPARSAKHACANWNARYAGKEALSTVGAHGYKVGSLIGRKCTAHRAIYAIMHGEWPSAEVDHIDGNRLNNRPSNLRAATRSQNQCNVGPMRSNTSGAKGVSWDRNRGMWRADIMLNGKRKHLGMFGEVAEGAAAYALASKAMHQEFGRAA